MHSQCPNQHGRADNIFVERLRSSLKYENVYLNAYQDVAEARHSIAAYFDFYNHDRLHQALGYRLRRQVFKQAMRVAKLRRRRNAAGANRAARHNEARNPGRILYLKIGQSLSQ